MSIRLFTTYPGEGIAMPAESLIVPLGTALISGAFSMANKPKAPDNSAAVAEMNREKQAQTLQQRQAANQTAELDKQLAAQQAAVIARRSGGGLSYTGPQGTPLKTTFGG